MQNLTEINFTVSILFRHTILDKTLGFNLTNEESVSEVKESDSQEVTSALASF